MYIFLKLQIQLPLSGIWMPEFICYRHFRPVYSAATALNWVPSACLTCLWFMQVLTGHSATIIHSFFRRLQHQATAAWYGKAAEMEHSTILQALTRFTLLDRPIYQWDLYCLLLKLQALDGKGVARRQNHHLPLHLTLWMLYLLPCLQVATGRLTAV